jgi:hypothetical protein
MLIRCIFIPQGRRGVVFSFYLGIILAVIGAVVPIVGLVREFVISRKQLGYRVQMDTTARQEATSENAGAWRRLSREDGAPLDDPSFVLMRIENIGTTNIDPNDYATIDPIRIGVKIKFPGAQGGRNDGNGRPGAVPSRQLRPTIGAAHT